MDYSKNITDSECSLDKYYSSSKQEAPVIPPVHETSNIGNRSENVEALEEFKKMGLECIGCQDYRKVAELQEKKDKVVNTTASIGYSGSSEPFWEIGSEVRSKGVKPRATLLRLTQKGHMEEGVSRSSVKIFASKSEKRKKRKEETVDPRVTLGLIGKGQIETATRADYYIDQVEKSKAFASAGKENRLADKASLKTAPLIGPVSTYGVIVETKKGDNQNQIGKSFQTETIRQPLLQKPKSSGRICMRMASTQVECFSKSADVTENHRRGSPQTEAAEEAEHCSGIAENKSCQNEQAKMQNKNQLKNEVSCITRNALEVNINSSTEVPHACGEEDQENVQFASELHDYEKHFVAKLARSDVATSRFVEKYLLSSRKFSPSLKLSEFKECEETARPALTKGRTIENIAASLTEDGMEPRSANQNGLDISVVPVKCVGQGGTDCAIENTQELGRLDITSSHCKDNISSQTVSNGSQTVVSPALEYAPVGTIIKKQRKASRKKQRRIERNQRIENGDTIRIHESQSLKRPRVEGADSVVGNSKKLRTERVIPVKPSSLGISGVALPRPFPKCHVSEHKTKPLEISGVALPRPFPKCHVSENENKSLEISGVALPRPFPKCHLSERENEPLVHEEETAYREASSSEKNALKCGRISSTEGESSSTSVSGNMSEAVTNGLAKPRISIDKSMPTRIPLRIKKCMQLPLENITKAHIKRIKKWYKMGTWNDVLNKHEMNELNTNISPGEHDPSGHVWSKQQVSGVPFIPAFILDKLEALKQLSRDELTKGQRVAVNKWQKLLNKKTRLENQHMEQMKQIKSQSVKRPQAEDSDSIRRVSKKSRTKVNTPPTRSSLETAGVVDGISEPPASGHPEISSMKDIHKQTSIEASICEDASRELSSSVSKMLVSISIPNKICGGNTQSCSSAKPAAVTLSAEKSNHLCGDVSNHEADGTIASSMPPAPCHNVHVCQIVGHPAGSSGSEEYISTQLEIKSAQVVNGSEASISAKPTGVDQFGSLKAVSLHQDVSSCVRNAEESSLSDQKLTSCTGNVLKSSKGKSTGYNAGSGRMSKVSVSAEPADTFLQFGPPQELDSLIELILKSSEDGDGYSCSKTPDISVSAKTTGTTPQFSCTEASSRVKELDNRTDYIRSTEEMRCPVETVVISDSARLVDPHTLPATATALLPELGNAVEKVPKPTDGTSKTDTSNSIGTTAACVSSKPVESYDKLNSSKAPKLLDDATVCIENISKSSKTYSQVGSPKTSGVTEGVSSCLENKLKPLQDTAAEDASTGSAVSVSAKPVDTCSQFVSPQELNRKIEQIVKSAEGESTGYSCSKRPVMSVSAKITGPTSQSSCTVAAGLVQELSNPTNYITGPTEEVNCSAKTSVISDSTKLADQPATVAGLLPQLDNALGKVPQPTDSTSMTGTSSSVETTAACISSEAVDTYSEPGSSNTARLLEGQSVCIENISKFKEGAPRASSHSPKNFSQVGSPKASRPSEEQGAITESSSVSMPISEFNFKVTKPLQESRGFIGNTSKPSRDICASTADASSSLETLAICAFDKPEGTCSQFGITTQTGLIQEPTSSLLNKLKSTTEGICSSVEMSALVCDESVDTYSHFDSARKMRPLHESTESIPKSAGDTSTEDTSSTVAMSEASDSAIPGGAYFDLDPDKIAGLIQELDDCINEILNPAEDTSNSIETSVINESAKSENTYSQAGRVENISKHLEDGSKEDTSNSTSCVSNKSVETSSQTVSPNLTGPLQELDGCIEKLSKNCMSKEAATTSMETPAVCLSAMSSDTCSQVGNVEAEESLQNFKVCIGNVSAPTKDATRSVETSAECVPEENISKLPECKSGTVPSSDVGISATPPSANSKEPLRTQEVGIENIPKLTEDAISSVRALAESDSTNSTDTCCQVGLAQTNGPAPAQVTKTSLENFLRPTKDTSTSASTSSVGKVTEFVSAKLSHISFNSNPLTESESSKNTDSGAETSITPSLSELAAKHSQFCFVKEIELHQGVTGRIANTPKATENKSDTISNPCLTCLEKDLKNPAESFEEVTIAGKDISKLPKRKSGRVPSSDVGISAAAPSANSKEPLQKQEVGTENIPKPTEDATSSVRTSAVSVSAKSADTCSQVSLGKTNGPAEESYTSIENISKPTKDTSTSASTSSVRSVTKFVSSESTRNPGSCTEISITPSFSELAVKHDQFCFVKRIELHQGETGRIANTPNATQNNCDNNIASPCLTHTVNPAGSVEEATIAGEDIATLLECKSGVVPSSDEGISAVPVYAKSSDTYSQVGPIEAKESLQKLEVGIENILKPKEDATTSLRMSTESVSANSADTGSQVSLVNTNGPVQESNTSIENTSRHTNDTSTSDSTSPVGKVTEFVSAKPSDMSFNTKSLPESEFIRNTGSCEATLAAPSFSELAAKHGQFSFVKEIELLQGETSRIAKTPNATQNNFVNNKQANPCLTHSVNPAGFFEEATIAAEDISKPPERKSGTVPSSEIGISVVPVPVKAPDALPQRSFAEAARQLQSVRVSAVADRTAVNLEETSVSAKPLVATDDTVKAPVAPVQEVNTCKDASKPVMSKYKEAASTSETKSVTAAKKAPSATVDTQKENQSRKRRHDADSDGPGEIKRQRTKASLCPYRVAVVDKGYPEVILTRDQSDAIEMELADRLEKATRFDASATYQFSNCSYAGGVLWICCEDERTKVWLKRNIARMSSFWRGIRLKAVDEVDLPVRLKVMIFVPDHEPELKKFITCLDRENPGLTASNWHLIGKKSEDGGVIFAFTIDDNSYAMLENNDWQVSYKRTSLECKIMHKISDMWEYTSDGAGTSGTSKSKGREGNDKGYPGSWRNAHLKQSRKKKRYGNVRSFGNSIQVPYNGFLRF